MMMHPTWIVAGRPGGPLYGAWTLRTGGYRKLLGLDEARDIVAMHVLAGTDDPHMRWLRAQLTIVDHGWTIDRHRVTAALDAVRPPSVTWACDVHGDGGTVPIQMHVDRPAILLGDVTPARDGRVAGWRQAVEEVLDDLTS